MITKMLNDSRMLYFSTRSIQKGGDTTLSSLGSELSNHQKNQKGTKNHSCLLFKNFSLNLTLKKNTKCTNFHSTTTSMKGYKKPPPKLNYIQNTIKL